MKPYHPEKVKEQIAQELFQFQMDKSKIAQIGLLLFQIAPASEQNTPLFRFAFCGVARRLKIMEHCVDNIFSIRPLNENKFILLA